MYFPKRQTPLIFVGPKKVLCLAIVNMLVNLVKHNDDISTTACWWFIAGRRYCANKSLAEQQQFDNTANWCYSFGTLYRNIYWYICINVYILIIYLCINITLYKWSHVYTRTYICILSLSKKHLFYDVRELVFPFQVWCLFDGGPSARSVRGVADLREPGW